MRSRPLLVLLPRMVLLLAFLLPGSLVLASGSRPAPPSGIHAVMPVPDDPAPAPQENLAPDSRVFNNLSIAPPAPQPAEAQGSGGPGVAEASNSFSSGLTLFKTATACLDFNDPAKWHGGPWYGSYGGWGTFAVDDGGLYVAENVRFDMERTIGPGDRAGSEYSFKIASGQPYAAGLISPVFQAPAGATIQVRVKYLIFDHEGLQVGGQWVNDWVSLGIKPDAFGQEARYVNGYTRGMWSQLENQIQAGDSGQILVMLQAESPALFNSNIYFDDLEIYVNGEAVTDCE